MALSIRGPSTAAGPSAPPLRSRPSVARLYPVGLCPKGPPSVYCIYDVYDVRTSFNFITRRVVAVLTIGGIDSNIRQHDDEPPSTFRPAHATLSSAASTASSAAPRPQSMSPASP